MHDSTRPSSPHEKPCRAMLARLAGFALLAVVLALAFRGHLSAEMRVQWANFMSMCGF